VTGKPGSGKTLQALLLSYLISPKRFNPSCYAVTAGEFMDWVNDPNRQAGDCIVWDEPGIGLKARHWYSLSNIMVGETLQVYRKKKLNVFFAVTDFSFIDIQARKQITCFSEIQRFDLRYARMWLYDLKINRKTGDMYFPYYRAYINNRVYALKNVQVLNSAIKKLYERNKETMDIIFEKMEEFKEKTMKKDRATIQEIEKERFGKTYTIFDMANLVAKNREKCILKGKLNWCLIHAFLTKELGFAPSRDACRAIKFLIEKEKETNPQNEYNM